VGHRPVRNYFLETEELLEELLLSFRELGGGLEVHDHHQVSRGFAA
jgi:hypothetical protein